MLERKDKRSQEAGSEVWAVATSFLLPCRIRRKVQAEVWEPRTRVSQRTRKWSGLGVTFILVMDVWAARTDRVKASLQKTSISGTKQVIQSFKVLAGLNKLPDTSWVDLWGWIWHKRRMLLYQQIGQSTYSVQQVLKHTMVQKSGGRGG